MRWIELRLWKARTCWYLALRTPMSFSHERAFISRFRSEGKETPLRQKLYIYLVLLPHVTFRRRGPRKDIRSAGAFPVRTHLLAFPGRVIHISACGKKTQRSTSGRHGKRTVRSRKPAFPASITVLRPVCFKNSK